ncbi:hypothetical protein NDU88_005879 [Pleurodeles waltl]|uniref:Uncharacterized protein n=1 Tax=Pleurodeles waltl TaxID=8319 RepID=A0AAV7L5D0_PLEWA|nr:hypothetical protein NDU88_005879 [Pleurodeles waltl]
MALLTPCLREQQPSWSQALPVLNTRARGQFCQTDPSLQTHGSCITPHPPGTIRAYRNKLKNKFWDSWHLQATRPGCERAPRTRHIYSHYFIYNARGLGLLYRPRGGDRGNRAGQEGSAVRLVMSALGPGASRRDDPSAD